MSNAVITFTNYIDGGRAIEEYGRSTTDSTRRCFLKDDDENSPREVGTQSFKLVSAGVQLIEAVYHDQIIFAGISAHLRNGCLI